MEMETEMARQGFECEPRESVRACGGEPRSQDSQVDGTRGEMAREAGRQAGGQARVDMSSDSALLRNKNSK